MSATRVQDDMKHGAQVIEDATQTSPRYHRPPYGLYSSAGLRAARSRGLKPILWSKWGKDWRRFTTPERIAARATANLTPGDVILLHDADFYSSKGSYERTAQALPIVARELKFQEISTVLLV
jgi:peptidoglycan/xylan/chitin deacetylase (PgdA/CDA1 family)